jgi:exosortase D (VPLPA-CTERM-specific)
MAQTLGTQQRIPGFYREGSILAACFILVSQRQAELDLWTAWQTQEYSHGLLIPFIAILIGWQRLSEIKPPIQPSWLGIPCLIVAGGLELISRLSAFGMAEEYGLIIALVGIFLSFFGRAATYAVGPALFYLIFAVPLPHLVQATLSQQLQLLSSTLGVWPLDMMGISVYQEGNVIDLGGYRLQVVDACSGLRYLFPLMSFGYLIAFLLKDKLWKRIVLFLSTIPITIGLNSLRITLIGLTVDKWGQKMAEGFIHAFEGWVIFLICIALLMTEAWVLMRIGNKGRFRYEYFGRAPGPFFGEIKNNKAPGIAALLIAGALFMAFGSGIINKTTDNTPTHPAFASFPLMMSDWEGRPDTIDADVLSALQLSDYWIANYKRASDPAPVNLYMAYYASQGVGVTTHSPSNCIPGGGWQIAASSVVPITLENGAAINVTRLLIRRANAEQIVYYWFDERGRNLTETYSAKWYLLLDSISMHRTDGALVRIVTPVGASETEAEADQRLKSFMNVAYPKVKAFVPGAPQRE